VRKKWEPDVKIRIPAGFFEKTKYFPMR